MRRRRGRRRLAALVVIGAALLCGLTVPEYASRPATPGHAARENASADVAVVAPPAVGVVATAPAREEPTASPANGDRAATTGMPPAQPADTVVDPDPAAAPSPAETIEARPGDTPLKLLSRIGVAPDDAQEAARKLSSVWNPRDLRPGQRAAALVHSDRLLSFRLVLAPDREIVVARDHTGGFVVEDQDRPTRQVPTLGAGTIHTSLAAAAARADVPPAVLGEMIRAFSYDVDFQRDVQPGDNFAVLYQRIDDELGRPTGTGQMVHAELVLSGVRLRFYRFAPDGGDVGYYTENGENIRKPLLRTPIDGARISSTYGMRHHPVLGYTRMHQGVDFAAPSGTAIYAAGDGTVVRLGRAGGYGNYVEVEHNQKYTTAYAHLSAYARGLREGERVRQGEIIGYVGMTGTATGPHLHYEVHYEGAQVDPQSIRMPVTTRLAGKDLTAFRAHVAAVEGMLMALRQDRIAGYECRPAAC